mmetsp:Transcript_7474/g.14158  ORF Transcript_7474/g.14158 Transcript_7474/m.14158 type:complete len:251 (-) Transcript_7474:100-852(-)|eukprot:CAMPEP_0114235754 /NCGR_PEP_ID=MMETSP0058-20121206/6427_1 /TAXON_ID=36894 /ORGANISM="Pyramimonas parkeae, CCMP726" /LENGTH=250 /DNA_ID=CAMNT_0001347553 /DNA_START=45 /DNA_END=797 /DNA_ORIENTATION=-
MSANNNRFPHLIQLPHGAVLFKHWLDIEAQKQVVEMAFSLAAEANTAWVDKALSQEHPYIVCSYDKSPLQRPKDCVRACGLKSCSGACGRPFCAHEPTALYEQALDAVSRARIWQSSNPKSGVSLPEKFDPCTVWGLVYKDSDTMPCHLDRAEGWTLSISVGASVNFVIGREPEKGSMYGEYARHKAHVNQHEQHITFESGDLLLFEGDRLFHGVDGIHNGTAPEFWSQGPDLKESTAFARIGLLFRDGH